MATTVSLEGKIRSQRGKGAARKLRQNHRVPGVLYGKKTDPVLLDLDAKACTMVLASHSASNLIVDLKVDGSDYKTLIREIQIDPVSGLLVHLDLNQISLTDAIEVEIPIELQGVPTGVKNSGGILQQPLRTLAIKCLPQDMPDQITLDVTALEIGDSIHVSEIRIENVEIVTEGDISVALVSAPTKVEEPTEGEAEEAAEPEVVGKKKDEDEGGEGEKKEQSKKE